MSSEAIRAVAAVDRTSLVEKLMQKDRDLEVAAKIGQALLEQNKDLQQRTEFLEESLAKSSEEMVQLKHELDKKAELLRVYCHYDDDGFTREIMDDSLKKRLEKVKMENIQLKHDLVSFLFAFLFHSFEVFSIRRELETQVDRDRKRYEEVSHQFEQAQQQIAVLHMQVVERGEDYVAQSMVVEKLLHEISLKCCRERQLTAENEDLSRQVDEALQRQSELTQQMKELQERYTELRSMFCEAEEELSRFRSAPPKRAGSMDSLYDSLASEMENSDSGFSSTPAATARAGEALNLRLELQRVASETIKTSPSKEEVDVPSSVLAEVVRKRITIEPIAPPQTPQSETAVTPTETTECLNSSVELTRKLTCDASTSCTELAGPSLTPLITSTPKTSALNKTEGILQLSELRSICCTPSRSSSMIFTPKFHASLRRIPHSSTSATSKCSDDLEDYVAPKIGEPGIPGTRDLNYSLRMLKARRKEELEEVIQAENIVIDKCVIVTVTYLSKTADIIVLHGVLQNTSCTSSELLHAHLPHSPSPISTSSCMSSDLLHDYSFNSTQSSKSTSHHYRTQSLQVEQDYAMFLHRKGLPPSPFFHDKSVRENENLIDLLIKKVEWTKEKDDWIDCSVILGQDHQRTSNANSDDASEIGYRSHKTNEPPGILSRTRVRYRNQKPTQ
ncbi:HAP1 region [Dictyocaulus viviparus]|uniref:HAP1 region n=1 Tax=Dictyocaulus viviparus TaxID=29172 RepID=A0A0D8XY13_DICVI|nr:HAP1 region [Dictyocaulus viviparus]